MGRDFKGGEALRERYEGKEVDRREHETERRDGGRESQTRREG